jgi:heme-degrading monooxygenase HmoA
MYMRITWAKVQPGLWSAYEQEFKRLVDPTTNGLLARWLVHDSQDPDALFVVTLWDSLEAIRDWEASRYFNEQFIPGLKPFILGAYSVSVCEVSYAAVAPSLSAADIP